MRKLPIRAGLVQEPQVARETRPEPYGGGFRTMTSNRVVVTMLLLVIGATIYSIVQDMARQSQFSPVCASHGWRVTDTGPLQQPKCLDLKTGLMYVPPELWGH